MKKLINLGLILVLMGTGVYIDARYIEPKVVDIKKIKIETKALSEKTHLKIALFSDVHLGEHYGVEEFQKIVDKINKQHPDIIIFAGDLVDDNKTFTEEEGAITLLKELNATYSKYAVFGNHDHGGNGTRRYIRMMKAAEFNLLQNKQDCLVLENGDTIKLIGIDDIVLSKPDFKKPFEGLDTESFNLFISHAPDVVEHIIDQPINLQVSGHSHGGQVRLPFVGAPSTVPPYGRKYVKGMYRPEEKEDMLLYVNVGIGTSQLPYRFLNLPEITIFELKGTKKLL